MTPAHVAAIGPISMLLARALPTTRRWLRSAPGLGRLPLGLFVGPIAHCHGKHLKVDLPP